MSDGAFHTLPLDKWQWHPSPVAGQVVYAVTTDRDGSASLAPKSWVSMAAFTGPVIGFGCQQHHRTCRNATETGRFTLCFPTVEQARAAQAVASAPHAARLTVSGLTLSTPLDGAAPHLLECPAYCECSLIRTVGFDGGEVFLFGRIELMAVHEEICGMPAAEAYARLAPAFFLEPGAMAGLGEVLRPDAR
ncbi:flavin reductase family protein [Actinomyces oricola]|uniref:flavin reductase family protein n=1 Tax=Actinomyces oricola TaxID=206043 RepID=UPI000FFEF47D|nr:flavin reductase [Actinomyces oricola]